ncbi:MAG: hypothetical protein KAJ51_12470 [Thermoplasmata archaeon]|nr:hypothetical protein [Thermoplasmata archaeon]
MSDEPEVCEYCGKKFKKVANHLPYCDVKKLAESAPPEPEPTERSFEEMEDEIKKNDDIIYGTGKSQEIEVRASSTENIKTDRFWAWTEGLGIQIGLIIDSFTGINIELKAQTTLLTDIKNCLGNSYLALTHIKEHLSIVSTSFADAFEILQHGKIIDEDRIKQKAELKANAPGLGSYKPTPQEAADLESLEVIETIESGGVVSGVVSYKNDDTLPEHTRKIPATIQIITEKAMQLLFYNGKVEWIPKSTIKSTNDLDNKGEKATQQNFIIDSWVLIKNGVIPGEESN